MNHSKNQTKIATVDSILVFLAKLQVINCFIKLFPG